VSLTLLSGNPVTFRQWTVVDFMFATNGHFFAADRSHPPPPRFDGSAVARQLPLLREVTGLAGPDGVAPPAHDLAYQPILDLIGARVERISSAKKKGPSDYRDAGAA
jgi:hypothetical protein